MQCDVMRVCDVCSKAAERKLFLISHHHHHEHLSDSQASTLIDFDLLAQGKLPNHSTKPTYPRKKNELSLWFAFAEGMK